MFIFNVKVNGNKIFKIFFTIVTILLIFILVFVTYKIFSGASSSTSSCIPNKDIYEISTKNYTNVLKTVHDNIDTYVGKKICFTGYIYRIYDFSDNVDKFLFNIDCLFLFIQWFEYGLPHILQIHENKCGKIQF